MILRWNIVYNISIKLVTIYEVRKKNFDAFPKYPLTEPQIKCCGEMIDGLERDIDTVA